MVNFCILLYSTLSQPLVAVLYIPLAAVLYIPLVAVLYIPLTHCLDNFNNTIIIVDITISHIAISLLLLPY